MNNPLRVLITYAACVGLAILLGFVLAGPLTYSAVGIYGLVALILVFPLLLKWHYPLMLLSWNMAVIAFLLPGRPAIGLVMIVLSLGISIMQRMVNNQSQFIRVPQLTFPLLVMIGVIAVTAKMTGVGLHAFGSQVYGGKKYVYLVAGILGYFALSAQRIPSEKKNLYLGLFFLGAVTAVVGDLLPILPKSFYVIYMFFDFNAYALNTNMNEATRMVGAVTVAVGVMSYMLARYGVRGIFYSSRPWRWMIFILFGVYGLLGGFRGFLVGIVLLVFIQFFLEGLHKTKLMAVFVSIGLLGALALIPLADKLPYTFQRALSILPYKVSTAARMDAEDSSQWRITMWKALLPEIPQYLLLGKGYVISPVDYNFVLGADVATHTAFAQNQGLALAEDFHNGPISIIIPFGIWGCIAFLWFIAAGTWAVYRNYRYGDPSLKILNTFLLASFLEQTLFFLLIYGDFSKGMLIFSGILGLSVAFNGGVRHAVRVVQPATQTARPKTPAHMPLPAPAFQRRLPGVQ